jgi:hypothetical protein
MKKIAFTLLTLIGSYSFAFTNKAESAPSVETTTEANTPEITEQERPRIFTTSVQLATSTYKYSEEKMQQSGAMNGFALGTRIHPPASSSSFFIDGGIEYFTGKPEYDGQTFGGTPVTASSKNHFYTVQGLVGTTLAPDPYSSALVIDLSGGGAYRYLDEKTDGKGTYEREQTYIYAPLVGQVRYATSPRVTFVGGLELDIFLAGRNTSHLSQLSPEIHDVEFKQEDGTGSKLFAGFNVNMQNTELTFQLFYRQWNIEDSNVVLSDLTDDDGNQVSVLEPKNETTQTGLMVGLTF